MSPDEFMFQYLGMLLGEARQSKQHWESVTENKDDPLDAVAFHFEHNRPAGSPDRGLSQDKE